MAIPVAGAFAPIPAGSAGFTEESDFVISSFYFPMLIGVVEFDIGGAVNFEPADFMKRNSLGPKTQGSSIGVKADGVVVHVLAVALIWLGIGSVMARRWARALLLILSWSWLVTGVFVSVFMLFFIPNMMATMAASGTTEHPAMPPGAIAIMIIVMALIFGVLFVIVPAIWTFFYSSRHVKATCERRDPQRRWTDACPLPVLGFCLWLVLAVPMLLIMPLASHGVMPFFGIFLTGLPGSLLCLAMAALWSCAAWSLYKLQVRG